jgi:1-phosphatidylinositol-4-phosphate 5-kinase
MDHVVDKLVGQDGSTYIGTTRNGLPSGLGTCMWPDGSQYDGEWREGTMNGFGTYVWRSGQRYDGEWKVGCHQQHLQHVHPQLQHARA